MFVEGARRRRAYLARPERALVLSVDEESQFLALNRTLPLLTMRPGQPERRSHDCTRHGATTLLAALAWPSPLQ